MTPAIVATVAISFSLVVGVLLGWFLRGLRPCALPHGPFLRVPTGGIGHIKLEGNLELGAGFVDVGQGGQLTVEVTDSTRLLPGDHDLKNVTIQGKS